jgi:hypothetical protein
MGDAGGAAGRSAAMARHGVVEEMIKDNKKYFFN